jgi:hypothetical protein
LRSRRAEPELRGATCRDPSFRARHFGWTALVAALLQLWRPNVVVFGIGLISASFGLVLYNTRLSALAVALLVLSLARARPGAR